VAAAYLALAYLSTGKFPPGAEALARYVDKVDQGSLGMTLANPYSLYAAHMQLSNRLSRQPWNSCKGVELSTWRDITGNAQYQLWNLEPAPDRRRGSTGAAGSRAVEDGMSDLG
jgi:hypothetical protein